MAQNAFRGFRNPDRYVEIDMTISEVSLEYAACKEIFEHEKCLYSEHIKTFTKNPVEWAILMVKWIDTHWFFPRHEIHVNVTHRAFPVIESINIKINND